jgi:hypothetical protein
MALGLAGRHLPGLATKCKIVDEIIDTGCLQLSAIEMDVELHPVDPVLTGMACFTEGAGGL